VAGNFGRDVESWKANTWAAVNWKKCKGVPINNYSSYYLSYRKEKEERRGKAVERTEMELGYSTPVLQANVLPRVFLA